MSVTIRFLSPVIQWSLPAANDTCYICRKRFADSCLRSDCDSSCNQCEFLLSQCKHGYHRHCLPEGATVCYVCREPLRGLRIITRLT
ncbi:Zinc finger, RING-type domain [Squirrelpox virus]|uniref:A11L n=1 Tax=Squirrelpox virus TaxID=240426 RepID=Q6VFS1_9POXV|nr:Zinc finger, RING-type domain [Squirrelpox virus]AAQ24189.1 putative 026L protein [Squirrelpox virus]ABD51453.1 A11L [Squirrelpox virus]CCD83202.1 Zinc finger, RING-type domain [Squirrelpox virus]